MSDSSSASSAALRTPPSSPTSSNRSASAARSRRGARHGQARNGPGRSVTARTVPGPVWAAASSRGELVVAGPARPSSAGPGPLGTVSGVSERILEGRWDCEDCGRTGIGGIPKSCPGCGAGRDPINQPSETPYLDGDATDITGTSVAAELGTRPDRICDHCGQANHADASSCRGCGQALDVTDETVPTRTYTGIRHHIPKITGRRPTSSTSSSSRTGSAGRSTFASARTATARAVAPAARALGTPARRAAAGGVAVVALVAVVWVSWAFAFATKPVTVEVTDLAWSRGVEVEEFRTLQKSSFDPPGDARIHRSYQAVHHHRQVPDGYATETRSRQVAYSSTCTRSVTVDNGNGTFSQRTESYSCTQYRSETYTTQVQQYRSEPVYRTKYDFEIDRWVTDFFFTVDDSDAELPYWPEMIPAARADKHRVGDERTQTYTATLTNGDRDHEQHPALDVWLDLDVGDELVAHVNRSGKIRSVDWPEP